MKQRRQRAEKEHYYVGISGRGDKGVTKKRDCKDTGAAQTDGQREDERDKRLMSMDEWMDG